MARTPFERCGVMLPEAQPAKSALGVDGENLLRRAIGEYRDRDRD